MAIKVIAHRKSLLSIGAWRGFFCKNLEINGKSIISTCKADSCRSVLRKVYILITAKSDKN